MGAPRSIHHHWSREGSESATGTARERTYEDYARLPDDGNRREVIDGEVCVTPALGPAHQRVAAELFIILPEYVGEHGLGEILWDVGPLFARGQFLRPDMLFAPAEQRRA
jgi:Uma2 family endonuclease